MLFDFEKVGDKFYYDCEEVLWVIDMVEFDELWCQCVKYDVFNLKFVGKELEKIKELLIKCYECVIKCLK